MNATQHEQSDGDADVEQLLRRTRFATTVELDERILGDATRELRPAADGSHSWRRAAIIVVAIGAAIAVIAYLQRPNVTLAQIAEQFQKQAWVHVTYDNGREEWANLADGREFFKDFGGRTVAIDPGGERLMWWPQQHKYIERDKWYIGDKVPPRAALSVWDRYAKSYGVPTGAKPDGVEQHDDTLDGKKVVRFDAHFIDLLGRRILVKQVWADPASKLPLRVRDTLDLADREAQKRDAIVGTFTFPTTGPSSIHDLGVPKDAPIVDLEAKPAADVVAIQAATKAALAKFPASWRIVRWNTNGFAEADVEYRDGARHASARWFQNEAKGYPNFPKEPATVEQVLAWMKTRPPIDEQVSDAAKDYSRENPVPGLSNNIPQPTARVTAHSDFGPDINFPPGLQWTYADWVPPPTKVDPAPPDVPAGLLVLRREMADQRTDYWIDPAKDYALLRATEWRLLKGKWRTSRIDSLDGWVQLPGGAWFAAIKKQESFGVFPKLTDKPYVETWRNEITLMKQADFPPDTFNGEKLLKDAKLESY